MPHRTETCDIAVLGAGHAGCEAALAAARLGFSVVLFTVSIDAVAMMPCNPNIGGTSKGHLVREVDALGGEMGKNIDKTFLQSRMLNTSKGPAVHSLRAQADKQAYTREMRRTLEREPLVRLRQAEVSEILTENGAVTGVRTASGAEYTCRAAVLCSGTYLRSRCVYGDVIEETGPGGLRNARLLTDCLHRLGIRTVRLKTGTPARVDGRTVDISRMEEQRGDDRVVPFSFTTDPESVQKDQVPCYLTYTNEETHRIIRENVDRSPLFSGVIEGKGPRYCPSIEDKVVRFADRPRHQIFVEPEGLYTNELYLSGLSSSLPEDVQAAMIRTIPGLENAEIVRNAYAIEYDALASGQLRHSLELRGVRGLFAAGQFNGSSGYEEAAAQGLMAGINAARMLQGREPVVLTRAQGYIGVLIDDLVTKELTEPYRMMTARAEYRLLLRQDNADQRLTPIGYDIGLISESRMRALEEKVSAIRTEIDRLSGTYAGGERTAAFLAAHGSAPTQDGISLAELLRRPELDYETIAPLDENRPLLPREVWEEAQIEIRYAGYLARERAAVERFSKVEKRRIPPETDYAAIRGLRTEAAQKLAQHRPENLGQASRLDGVTPADIAVLLIYLSQQKRRETENGERG
ncbi:MAG: tRNA uridine-5-carboxymethylaminomethyl(34) synthesis enzyme MnmG [Lachnospiraceae bacterium]|nr:tRNA uridine-5-carboxymethylaminomethyl(34) synthesis enzyme MnmG [Lachnospiraceae bacterium]